MKKRICLAIPALVTVLGISVVGLPAEGFAAAKQSGSKKPQQKAPAVKVLNNPNCPVMNSPNPVGRNAPSTIYKGYKVSLCCQPCIPAFYRNPDAYLQIALANSPNTR